MGQILILGEVSEGHLTDASQELLTKAREIADHAHHQVALVVFSGKEAAASADADELIVVSGGHDQYYHPEVYEESLVGLASEMHPALILMANTTMGMDLGASLAARLNLPMIAYCTALGLDDGGQLVATSQVYGGKLSAEVEVPLDGAVVTVIPGSWPVEPAKGSPSVRDMSASGEKNLRVVDVIEADAGADVDITRQDILVSVGRGIEDPDNIELAEELAQALGGVVSCSRPVVDAGWMPRSRQVGKSGQTVKPKLYLAFGISGAPEHLQGMKDAELIVAINNDENAPIFEVADFGATVDILDLIPALTEKLQGRAG